MQKIVLWIQNRIGYVGISDPDSQADHLCANAPNSTPCHAFAMQTRRTKKKKKYSRDRTSLRMTSSSLVISCVLIMETYVSRHGPKLNAETRISKKTLDGEKRSSSWP
jgi:hypothetical protein